MPTIAHVAAPVAAPVAAASAQAPAIVENLPNLRQLREVNLKVRDQLALLAGQMNP